MKKILIVLLCIPCLCVAQQYKNETVVSFGVGRSLYGRIISTAADFKFGNTELNSDPAFLASVDLGVNEIVSFGLALGYQKVGLNFYDYEYTNLDGDTITEDFLLNVTRTNIGARALLHYGKMARFDLYSGMRLGFQSYKISANTLDTDFDLGKFRFGFIAPQFILFGARGYIIKSLGFHAEMAILSPYFLMGGLQLRLGGNK